ncbi:hypothetical protein Tco_1128102 [Tanacetum coccineum]
MECLVKRFMVMILREFGVNPPRIKVISVKVIEMDGKHDLNKVVREHLENNGVIGGGFMVESGVAWTV